jgi:hypothetical protein
MRTKRSWKNYTHEGLEEEAGKVNWENIINNVTTEKGLDRGVTELNRKINEVMDKVALVITVKVNQDFIGLWVTPELNMELKERNTQDLAIKIKDKAAANEEKRTTQRARNLIISKVKHAKGEALRKKAGNDLDYSGSMYMGVMEFLHWRSGGAPEMLVDEGKVVRTPRQMSECLRKTYERKLKKVEKVIGELAGDYLSTLHNMTRGKVRTFTLKKVTLEDVERKLREVDDKPSCRTCGVSYSVNTC